MSLESQEARRDVAGWVLALSISCDCSQDVGLCFSHPRLAWVRESLCTVVLPHGCWQEASVPHHKDLLSPQAA